MIEVTAHDEGATFAVRAQPGARRNAVVGEHAGAVKVAVTSPPEGGRANAAIIEVLRDWIGCQRSEVELVAGAASRRKRFLVRGASPAELAAKLSHLLGPE